MQEMWSSMKAATNRRSFMKSGLATAGVGLLAGSTFALAEDGRDEHGRTSAVDSPVAMRPCFASPRQRKSWKPTSGCSTTNSAAFRTAKSQAEPEIQPSPPPLPCLDADMAQYVHDNTDDEFTH